MEKIFGKKEGVEMRGALRKLEYNRNLIGAEIGVLYGNYALEYLNKLDIKRMYLIDPYSKYIGYKVKKTNEKFSEAEKEAHEKLVEFEKKIVWIKNKSQDVANIFPDNSFDFVYIDGNHQYEYVMLDIALYFPKVKVGGLLCGHDYCPGKTGKVYDAVNDFSEMNDLILETSWRSPKENKMDWWIWK